MKGAIEEPSFTNMLNFCIGFPFNKESWKKIRTTAGVKLSYDLSRLHVLQAFVKCYKLLKYLIVLTA
jgi:hypothetical protein